MPISGEAAFSVTEKNAKGNLCTIRGANYDEFYANVREVLGDDADEYMAGFAAAFGGAPPTPAQAVQTVKSAFPGAQPVPVPVPGAAPAAPVAAPPIAGGGNCAHGARVYKSSETARGTWARWECAIPWSKGADNSARCKAVNV